MPQHSVAPDATKASASKPTHYHCYKWTGSGQEWDRFGATDTLDANSPDRPPIRTIDWLVKSSRFIEAVHTDPVAARDWLIGEWKAACRKAMNPVPAWVNTEDRAERALHAIKTGHWPSYSQWLEGGVLVLMAVVGTNRNCH